MKTIKVRATFMESILGSLPANPELYSDFIASKSPDAKTMEQELKDLSVDEVEERDMTIFPKLSDGTPFVYDYQIRGFFKNACQNLRKIKDTPSSKLTAFKKVIDGLIFVNERKIPIHFDGEIGNLQRPLRASTAQGERVALANSETVSAGAQIEFTVIVMQDGLVNTVKEWLDYGRFNGLGQWHNSGHGRFEWEEVDEFEFNDAEKYGSEIKKII